MSSRNYEIMNRNTIAAIWQNNTLTVLNEALLPLYLRRIHNADMWLETRAIDSHRANSRLLKKALRLIEKDDISTVIHVNGATITDTYWIRPIGSKLTYDDIRFDNDYFAKLALNGSYNSFNKAANSRHSKTPELTNTGSFEKCWKLIGGEWWMFKSANHNEQFSELFAYKLGSALGMNMAVYERGDKVIKSLDFTNGASVNFEPAMSFMGDNEDYSDTIKALETLCPIAIPEYIRMLFLDTVIANPDRHTNNFGLIRDTETGTLIGLAPIFDHNMALISRGYPSKPKSSDLLITLFNELLDKQPKFKKYLPTLTEDILRNIIKDLHMRVRTQDIIDIVMGRYLLIQK